MKTNKTLTTIIAPVIAAALAYSKAANTFYNTLVDAWSEAKDAGITPKAFREAIYAELDQYATDVKWDNGKTTQTALPARNTVNVYLIRIDESAFRIRAKRSDATGKAPAANGFSRSKIVHAAAVVGLTKAQVTALFKAMEG